MRTAGRRWVAERASAYQIGGLDLEGELLLLQVLHRQRRLAQARRRATWHGVAAGCGGTQRRVWGRGNIL